MLCATVQGFIVEITDCWLLKSEQVQAIQVYDSYDVLSMFAMNCDLEVFEGWNFSSDQKRKRGNG